jgi:hypothetical protein
MPGEIAALSGERLHGAALCAAQLDREGFAWVRGFACAVDDAIEPAARPMRDVLAAPNSYRDLARSEALRTIACRVLGPAARLVRATLFAKSAEARWSVPWHQDRVVCLAARASAPSFAGWSIKDGLPHALAPWSVLSRMLALRVHLDDCPMDAGPLEVVPRSHRAIHDARARERLARAATSVPLPAARGDVLVMRPLLLHRSQSPRSGVARRILHLELAAESLPVPLAWHY